MSSSAKLPKIVWNTIAGRVGLPEMFNKTTQGFSVAEQNLTAEFSEEDSRFVIKVDVPGVEKEFVQVSYDEDTRLLTVTAQDTGFLKEDEKLIWSDRAHGFKSRSFSVPPQVHVEQIAANHANGVLKLCLPKKEGKNKLRIVVN